MRAGEGPRDAERFDLVVVGTGSGLDVASWAVQEGWRVAVVEKGVAGGTCLNRGCIPSKMLLHSADVAETIRRAGEFGLTVTGEVVADLPSIVRRVNAHVDGESGRIGEALAASENPRYFHGEGRFVGMKRLKVGDVVIEADKFLLATGARPRIPEIPGLREAGYLTSTEALRLEKLPESMVILGGGFIAAELGHVVGARGTKVTIVQRRSVLLAREDREVAEAFTRVFGRKHRLLLGRDATRVERVGSRVRVRVKDAKGAEESVDADHVLVAAGLTMNSDTLDLAETGVEVDEKGLIRVDEYLETRVPGIFALGDAVGRFYLKHNANHEAQYAFSNMANPAEKIAVDYSVMPSAVFSSPQVASVGATEEDLKRDGKAYLVGRHRYYDTGMGKALLDRDGFVKMLVDPESGLILGCHILGPDASTLIHEVIVMMYGGGRAQDLASAVHVHPALPEVLQRAAGNLRPADEG